MSNKNGKVSIVMPCFNEENSIGKTINSLLSNAALDGCEIVVVDDGSTDHSVKKIEQFSSVKLVKHGVNKGYGSAIASGCRVCKGEYVVWMDSDGQHRSNDVANIIEKLVNSEYDWIVGCRDLNSHQVPSRKFGKYILSQFVRASIGTNDLDFNSGLRGFKTKILKKYLSFIEGGFGASTTTTLLMKKAKYNGTTVDITVDQRVGTSSVRQVRDGMRTLLLIFKIAMLFSPIKIFGGLGVLQFVLGLGYGLIRAFLEKKGFPVLSVIITISGVQTIFLSLILDQIAQIRFAINEK